MSRDQSAFKPYSSSSTTSVVKVESTTQQPSSTSPIPEQTRPYDYSVDKILSTTSSDGNSSKNNSLSALPLAEVTKWPSLPLDIIARQLWIENQRTSLPDLTGHSAPSTTSTTTSMCSTDLRRILFPSYPVPPVPRAHRGPRRQRTTFTHEQTLRLEMEYHISEYISRGKRFQLAEMLDLTENQIKIWFQNRRAKDKRIEKAIAEQQYRFLPPASLSQTLTNNCSTCSYTKHHFHIHDDHSDPPV